MRIWIYWPRCSILNVKIIDLALSNSQPIELILSRIRMSSIIMNNNVSAISITILSIFSYFCKSTLTYNLISKFFNHTPINLFTIFIFLLLYLNLSILKYIHVMTLKSNNLKQPILNMHKCYNILMTLSQLTSIQNLIIRIRHWNNLCVYIILCLLLMIIFLYSTVIVTTVIFTCTIIVFVKRVGMSISTAYCFYYICVVLNGYL